MGRPRGRPPKHKEPAMSTPEMPNFDADLATHMARTEEASREARQAAAEQPARAEASPSAPPARQNGEEMYPEPVRLLYNYRPKGIFKVLTRSDPDDPRSPMIDRDPVGEREILDAKGRVVETAKDEFAKVRAGNIIRLPKDEARRLLMSRRAEITDVEF